MSGFEGMTREQIYRELMERTSPENLKKLHPIQLRKEIDLIKEKVTEIARVVNSMNKRLIELDENSHQHGPGGGWEGVLP